MAKRSQKGLTLLELTAAMSLMGVVGLSFAYLYVNSNRYLAQSVASSASQGEASYAMEHIKRQLLHAVNVTMPAVEQPPQSQLNFQLQRVVNGPWILGRYELRGRSLVYSETGNPDFTVANNITGITFTRTSRVQLGVSITAEVRTGGDVRQNTLDAAIGLRGMFQ